MNFDALVPALRSYRIYKYLMLQEFTPVKFEEEYFLVKNDKLKEVKKGNSLATIKSGKPITDKVWGEMLSIKKLRKIPTAFGQNLSTLKDRLVTNNHDIDSIDLNHIVFV